MSVLDELKKQGGCALILYAYGIFMIVYAIYWFASGGNPENKKFFDDCYDRQIRPYYRDNVPDYEMRAAIAECMNQQARHLGLRDPKLRAAP